MAKKDKLFKVDILTTGPKPEPVIKGQSGPLVFNKDTDKMKKVDYYVVRFQLDDPSKTNLRFIQDKADVFWVHEDLSICPNSPCSMPSVIWVDSVDNDGKWVDIVNMDMAVQQFRFTLNLADKGISNPTQADYVPLDPIGDNQDRGSAGYDRAMSFAMPVTVGIVAGVAAFAAAREFLPQLAW